MRKIPADVFTDVQIAILKMVSPGKIVHDHDLLRKFAGLGVVKLHRNTGNVVWTAVGTKVKASYIESAETFEVEGVGIFCEKYFDSYFHPYLIRTEE